MVTLPISSHLLASLSHLTTLRILVEPLPSGQSIEAHGQIQWIKGPHSNDSKLIPGKAVYKFKESGVDWFPSFD